jgi:hypothetical protein
MRPSVKIATHPQVSESVKSFPVNRSRPFQKVTRRPPLTLVVDPFLVKASYAKSPPAFRAAGVNPAFSRSRLD